jgi:hypothetical protein
MSASWLGIQSTTELWVLWKWKHCQTAVRHEEGQGELRGKQHRSNRCQASAVWKDHHLHRREERPIGSKLNYEWQRLCWFTEELTLATPDGEYNGWEIQKKKIGKLLVSFP